MSSTAGHATTNISDYENRVGLATRPRLFGNRGEPKLINRLGLSTSASLRELFGVYVDQSACPVIAVGFQPRKRDVVRSSQSLFANALRNDPHVANDGLAVDLTKRLC
jgi:hypothetical protein